MNETDDNESAMALNSNAESDTICISDDVDEHQQQQQQQQQLQQQQQQKQPEMQQYDDKFFAFFDEMNSIFEERITEINEKASGDYKLKSVTYKEWVDMLIGVIHQMFESLSELEENSKTNITLLEKKLNECKISDHSNLNNENLQNDLMNLLTLIRRAIEECEWNTTELNFKTITLEQIFGNRENSKILNVDIRKINSKLIENGHQIERLSSQNNVLKTELEKKDLLITNLETKVKKLESSGFEYECISTTPEKKNDEFAKDDDYIEKLESCVRETEQLLAKQMDKNVVLSTELEVCKAKCDRKEKVIDSMKSLAFEVADKHDQIQQHKSQIFAMEEELQQALKKIQFKDSVIKDLRRDLKNHLTKHTDENQQDVHKRIDFEESKLIACQAEEDINLKILGLELDELCELKQSVGDENTKEFDRFRAKMRSVMADQIQTKNKLQFIRNQLIKIVHGKYENDDTVSNVDCGYISQEESEFDIDLLKRVNGKITNLENELISLKNQIEEFQIVVERAQSNVSLKTQILNNSNKILRELGELFSKISGTAINVIPEFDNSNEIEFQDVSLYRNLFCEALENFVIDKDRTIAKLQEYNQEMERNLKQRESFILEIKNELKDKTKMVEDLTILLKNNTQYNDESIKLLTHEKNYLIEEVKKFSDLLKNTESKKLLNEIEELQILNKNQVKTIANLMEALETIKRDQHTTLTAGNVLNGNDFEKTTSQLNSCTEPSNIIGNNQSRSGSLWGWLRGNTYDV